MQKFSFTLTEFKELVQQSQQYYDYQSALESGCRRGIARAKWNLDDFIFELWESTRSHADLMITHYFNDYEEYVYDIDFTLEGTVIAEVYLYEDVIAYSEAVNSYDTNTDEFIEFPKPKFIFPVPLTRGYCDTAKRDATKQTDYDINYAVQEELDRQLGHHKVQPWELRQAMHDCGMIADFNMEESEIEDLIAMVV